MSLISCPIIIKNNEIKSYSCKIINSKELSYYISSKSEPIVENVKGTLIEYTVVTEGINSCVEFEKEKLGSSYYINAVHKKIIKCEEGENGEKSGNGYI